MSDKNFKIIFITDMHLVYDEHFLGIDTFASFNAVVNHILEFHSDIDCLIVGGDLVQDQKKESFDFFKYQIDRLNCPKLFARGNHDLSDNFFSMLDNLRGKFSIDNWEIIRIDTYSEGNIFGEVDLSNLQKIIYESNKINHRNFILYMHHNLFLTNSPWLDVHITKNKEKVLDLISKIKNLKLVINGHIHQETLRIYKGISFISSPSTGVQFTSNENNFKLDEINPGYLIIQLNENGNNKTACQRVNGYFGTPVKNPKTY